MIEKLEMIRRKGFRIILVKKYKNFDGEIINDLEEKGFGIYY